jgi:hypothetical protein
MNRLGVQSTTSKRPKALPRLSASRGAIGAVAEMVIFMVLSRDRGLDLLVFD